MRARVVVAVIVVMLGAAAALLLTPLAGPSAAEEDAAGARLFTAASCSACHENRDAWPRRLPDHLSESTLAYTGIVEVITEGRGAMPPYGAELTGREIALLARHVLSFRHGSSVVALADGPLEAS